MRSPRHLWSGDWRSQSEEARDAAAQERERALAAQRARDDHAGEADLAAAQTRGRRRPYRPYLTAVAVAALTAVAVAAGVLIAGGRDTNKNPGKPLPALSATPIQPHKGQTRAGAIYAKASPAVVSIRTQSGSGTGFLIDRNGTLVTNAHVVEGASSVVVRFGQHGKNIQGDVRGTDPSSDLAVVHISPGAAPSDAKPLGFADSREVQVGDTAIAIGNPFGLDRTATEGIVSGLGREIQAPNGFSIDEVIQTDAPINPGNSGGPLLDITGRVIGVNSQIATGGNGSNGNVGIGFAVPSNTVRQVVPTLERGESIRRAWLGVSTTTPLSGKGAEVSTTVADGPADRAGLQQGDVIRSADGQPVNEPADVARIVAAKRPGDKITLGVTSGGQERSVDVRLRDRPSQVP